jgi:hypothetical protein
MDPAIREIAEQVMVARKFKSFSGFLEALIREEWERRQGKPTALLFAPTAPTAPIAARIELNERATPAPVPAPASTSVTYTPRKKAKRSA